MEIISNLLTYEGTINKRTRITCDILIADGGCNARISSCQTENTFEDFANTPEGLYLSEKIKFTEGAAYSCSTKIKHRQGGFGVLSSC